MLGTYLYFKCFSVRGKPKSTEAQRRQHKITFVFCILCFIFCIFVFYILYFCVLYFVFLCFIFFVFYILYFVFYILYFCVIIMFSDVGLYLTNIKHFPC